MVSKLAETVYQFRLLPISKTGRNLSANSRTLHIVPKLYRSLGSGVKYRLVLECDTSWCYIGHWEGEGGQWKDEISMCLHSR